MFKEKKVDCIYQKSYSALATALKDFARATYFLLHFFAIVETS